MHLSSSDGKPGRLVSIKPHSRLPSRLILSLEYDPEGKSLTSYLGVRRAYDKRGLFVRANENAQIRGFWGAQ
ncbi:hypothetical protein [Streptomyces sp. NPDC002853]